MIPIILYINYPFSCCCKLTECKICERFCKFKTLDMLLASWVLPVQIVMSYMGKLFSLYNGDLQTNDPLAHVFPNNTTQPHMYLLTLEEYNEISRSQHSDMQPISFSTNSELKRLLSKKMLRVKI